jgi:hypothetical protein
MKKNILILATFFLLLNAVKVHAQQEGTLWVNLITGVNSTWIFNQNAYGNPEIEYATTFGFTGGIGASYYFSDKWGFSPSVLASKLGQNYSGQQSGGDAERKLKLTYVEVPLLFMMHIPYAQNPTWISFGPDIMILANAQQEYFRKGGEPLPNPDGMKIGDVRERFNPTDVALSFAINKLYKLDDSGKSFFLLSFNTAFGLTDINSVEWKIPNMKDEYGASHNFYIGIKAGLSFKASRDKQVIKEGK